MDQSRSIYDQQRRNADSLRHQLRYPIAHGHNLPRSVDLRRWMTEIEDQRDMGSCVANALAGSLEYLFRRHTGKALDVSRLFIDFNARLVNIDWSRTQHLVIDPNNPDGVFETHRKAGIRGLQQYGFCEESLWPYKEKNFLQIPPKHVYRDAAHHSIVPLRVPINIDSVKTCLAHQIPVLVGIALSSDCADNKRGYIEIPTVLPNEGYHACLVVGYNDRDRHFIVRNSWGRDWGDEGYCYIPYAYLVDKRLLAPRSEFWAIVQIVPRDLRRRGYLNYPNFRQHHLKNMAPLISRCYQKQPHNHRHHRKRPDQHLSQNNFHYMRQFEY